MLFCYGRKKIRLDWSETDYHLYDLERSYKVDTYIITYLPRILKMGVAVKWIIKMLRTY